MILGRLLHAFHRRHFRQNIGQQPLASSSSKPRRAPPSVRMRDQFVANAFRRDAMNRGVMLLYCCECLGLNFEAKARGKAHRPHNRK